MGPLATVDFMQKVILATPAGDDAEHVPLLIHSDPRIPSRPAAILAGGASPLPALLTIRDRLLDAGARGLVMPCNTAHQWYPELREGCPVPFPSIIDAGCDAVASAAPAGARIAVIATRATLACGLFDAGLAERGYIAVRPDDALLDAAILPAIADVKAGRLASAGRNMGRAVATLLGAVSHVVLACTEAPVALAAAPAVPADRCIDPTQALAEATVALWRGLAEQA